MPLDKERIRRKLQGIPEEPQETLERLHREAKETGKPAIGMVGKTRVEVSALASISASDLVQLLEECPDKEFAKNFKIETYKKFPPDEEIAMNKADIRKLIGDKDTSESLETNGPSVKKEVSPDDPDDDFSRNPHEGEDSTEESNEP